MIQAKTDPQSSRALSFDPKPAAPGDEPAFAVVVIAVHSGGFLLADIRGRGWCAPSGRIEPGESPYEASARELFEETGARAERIVPIGRCTISEAGRQVRYVDVFAASVREFSSSPPGEDAREARLYPFDRLPRVYGEWNPVFGEVFRHASEILDRASEGSA